MSQRLNTCILAASMLATAAFGSPLFTPFSPLSPLNGEAQAAITTQLSEREIEVRGEGSNAGEALNQSQKNAVTRIASEFIHTPAEQSKLDAYLPTLQSQASQYLERLNIVSKGTLPNGGRFYVIRYRVAVGKIQEALVAKAIILAQSEINEALQFPTLAVYFKDPLNQSEMAQWSVQRCNSLLLNQGFQIIDPKIWHELALEDQQLSQNTAAAPQRMALKARANVFLEIDVDPKAVGKSGNYTYVQTPVRVRAFESSSGRPFLDKTYQRINAQGEPEALAISGSVDVSTKAVIEEAVAGVMPMIIQDLTRHWKESMAKGSQYRLVFHPPLSPALETRFKQQVKDYALGEDGEIWVRYPGALADLIEQLEENFEENYTLQSSTLGLARFEGNAR
jgi:hypothetical protein